jgi:hypothetical protein
MNDNEQQAGVANFVAAFAHIMAGQPGRSDEFRNKTRIIVTGARPTVTALHQHADQVKRDGLPIIWICLEAGMNGVPVIGLAARVDDQLFIAEECFMWAATSKAQAKLVPSGFDCGAFAFDDDLRLTYTLKAPRKSTKTGMTGITKACGQLREIEYRQKVRGDMFPLPDIASAA